MQLNLTGVDRRKEVAPDEGEQHAAENQDTSRNGRREKSVAHQTCDQIGVARAKAFEPAVEPHVGSA